MILLELILAALTVSMVQAVRTQSKSPAGIIREHTTVTVKEKDKVILPCRVDNLGSSSLIWVNPRKTLISLLDSRMIDDHRLSVERPYTGIWNLLIRSVRYNDSGTYECRVNRVPEEIFQVTLEVLVPPMIISEMSSDKMVHNEGETATLICNVTGVPTPNVTWFKRNYKNPDLDKERIGQEGEVLIIHNVTRHCDDIYECKVDNGVEPVLKRAIRVVVHYKPDVILPNPRRIGQQRYKETILECTVTAFPLGVTAWRMMGHGEPISNSEKYHTDIYDTSASSITLALRIRNLTKEDFRKYECFGSNFLGEASDYMVVYETFPATTTTTTTTTISTRRAADGKPGHAVAPSGKIYFPDGSDSRSQSNSGRNRDNRYEYDNTGERRRTEDKGTAPNSSHFTDKQKLHRGKNRNLGASSWNAGPSDGNDNSDRWAPSTGGDHDSADKLGKHGYWNLFLLLVLTCVQSLLIST